MTNPKWNVINHDKLKHYHIQYTAHPCPECNYAHLQVQEDNNVYEYHCPNCDYFYEDDESILE
mgnify:CR=1 FL=1